jgi:hypothetical protein
MKSNKTNRKKQWQGLVRPLRNKQPSIEAATSQFSDAKTV